MFASIASGLILLCFLFSACVPIAVATDSQAAAINDEEDAPSFQEVLWSEHPLVLYIQIGLMLAGALGVAALLPSAGDEQTE